MKRMLFTMLVMCLSLNVSAELTVIYDSGATTPIDQYVTDRVKRDPRPVKPKQPFTLPLKSALLTVSDVQPQEKRLVHLKQPFFLIGSDKRSEHWLIANKEQLVKINAVGMLVEAATMDDMERVAIIAKGLRIVPASADSIAKQLGLRHYPVLISAQGWEQ